MKVIVYVTVLVIALLLFYPAMTIHTLLHMPAFPGRLSAYASGAQYLDNNNVIFQTKSTNCGAAALKMIFDYHAIPVRLENIDSVLHYDGPGISMYGLRLFARTHFPNAEGWRFTFQDLKKQHFPLIVYLYRYRHYVVVDSIAGEELFYRDPSFGRLKITGALFRKIWNGESLVFY